MSTCISPHGEYGSHFPDDDYTCTRCDVLDEDALRHELLRLRKKSELSATILPTTIIAMAALFVLDPSINEVGRDRVIADEIASLAVVALQRAGLLAP
jgi:hypothetical protein